MTSLPSNVHNSSHPVLRSKISELRNVQLSAKQVRQVTSEISSILAVEASRTTLTVTDGPIELSAAGKEYATQVVTPNYALVPVLRSGLAMVDPFLSLLPDGEAPVYHLGLFREKTTLSPVEYYNKLPVKKSSYDLAFVIDPVVATGGTAVAVLQTLKEWGVKHIVFVTILASREGIIRAATEYPDGVDFYVGQIDDHMSDTGYILPGLGDIGDRLHSSH